MKGWKSGAPLDRCSESGVVGTSVDGLNDGDVSSAEAGLAVFKIVIPSANEGFVEAKFGELFGGGVEALMPVAEGFDVVDSEVFEVVEEHVGGLGEDIIDAADAHEEGAGEDHFLNPIDALGEALVSIIGDSDHLDGEEAFGFQDLVALGEEGFVELVADGFDHFDGDDFIEGALDVAVVLDADLELVFEAGVLDALAGVCGLCFGDGDAGDLTAVVCGGVAAEAAPATADFEDVVVGSELEFLTEGVVFCGLGIFDSGVGVFEFGAGVGHRFIEPEGVEFVSEIVVLGDVTTAGLDGVGALEVAEPIDDLEEVDAGKFVRGGVRALQGFHVKDEPGDDGADVGGVPDAIGVGLAHADVSIVGAALEELFVVIDFDARGDVGIGRPELTNRTIGIFHAESTEGHLFEESEDEFFGEAVFGWGDGVHGFLVREEWGRRTSFCASGRSDFL